jgi:hypothetical protein
MFPEYFFWQATVLLISDIKISHRMTTHPCSQQASNMTLQHARSKSAASLFSPLGVHFLRLDSWGRNPADHDKAHRNKWNTKTKRKHVHAPVFIRLRTRNIMTKKGLSHARKMAISRSTPSNKWTKTFMFSHWILKASGMLLLTDSRSVTKFYILLTVHLDVILVNDQWYLFHFSTCFVQQVLIIRRTNLCQYIIWYNTLWK